MKTIALLMLGMTLPVLAAGPEDRPAPQGTPAPEVKADWPQKGDTVYLSAKLEERFGSLPFLTAAEHLTVEACAPLTVKKGEPSEALTVMDDTGRMHRLMGDWSARLHRTKEACTRAASQGLPRVQAQGYRHRLIETH